MGNGAQSEKFEFIKLGKLRADKGLSKSDLSKRAGVAVNTITTAEKRKGNRRETLMKIFNSLNEVDLYNGALNADEFIKRKPYVKPK